MIVCFMLKIICKTFFIFVAATILAGCASNSKDYASLPQTQSNQTMNTAHADITENAFWQGNTYAIWDRLQHTSLQKLEAASVNSNPTQAAWIQFGIISKRYNKDSKQLVQQLIAWRNANPNHPANELFQNDGTLSNISNASLPQHIALLLPLEGRMGASGQAVRDGFLSAYYKSHAKSNIQQTITFLDTSNNQNISALYQQAINEGADLVVGPLIKEEVESLIHSGSVNVPTLALNYTDGSLPQNLYEFGLSPMDEAQQVADKAWKAGLSRAIIIAPQTPWGQRVTKNLITRWQSLGGKVTDTFIYAKQTDFNQSIANLLHIDTKEDRKIMQQDNNKTVLEKQRRQDFDVIFLLAEPQSARLIVPLLKYYYAENIPIYATSSIYSGSPNPQKDTDLNGVIFADIPWFLKSSQNTNRLYAVGRDAYVISSELLRLTTLPNFPLYAATGALTLTSDHKIYRRLPWAQMHNGHP